MENCLPSSGASPTLIIALTLRLPRGGWLPPPPYVFMRKNFFHMEYNFCNLGSCSRYIGAHFEVNIMVVAHAIQKLYPIYPRHQGGGGYHRPQVFRRDLIDCSSQKRINNTSL